MKYPILVLLCLLFSSVFFAQENHISIGPAFFQKEVACKIKLSEATDIIIRIFDENVEIKKFTFKAVQSTGLNMNLEMLTAGKTYTMTVFNALEEKLYTKEVTKSKNN